MPFVFPFANRWLPFRAVVHTWLGDDVEGSFLISNIATLRP